MCIFEWFMDINCFTLFVQHSGSFGTSFPSIELEIWMIDICICIYILFNLHPYLYLYFWYQLSLDWTWDLNDWDLYFYLYSFLFASVFVFVFLVSAFPRLNLKSVWLRFGFVEISLGLGERATLWIRFHCNEWGLYYSVYFIPKTRAYKGTEKYWK